MIIMTNYFKHCDTTQAAKAEFYRLAKIHHPDCGGDEKTFKLILNQYHAFEPFVEMYDGERETFAKYSRSFVSLMTDLIKIDGINIDIIGSWVWVDGDTKPNKEAIKSAGGDEYKARFNAKRKLWQISPSMSKFRKRSSTEHEKDDLRAFYGGQTVRIQKTLA